MAKQESINLIQFQKKFQSEEDCHQLGKLDTAEYSIEFSITDVTDVLSFALHIRGNDKAIDIIKTICHRTGWKALDGATGIIDFSSNPSNGFSKWRKFRNQILKGK
ncbi:hypothetical protein O9H85_30445 [Paenibacillus filicis]|uniref:Uncharacterized protein n=1 Tax=Paenibacillus gyeongsangnamensis TaxID=3388067 RepID=A0ABT4QIE1_9BACL|nr:hypothetical protein [Paenibacillus filicis]MCZ8516629.1 hypothetical protein [Paenibacillus filicis]